MAEQEIEAVDEGEWQLLPWLTAGFGAAAGLLFYLLIGKIEYGALPLPVWRQAGAAFVAVAALSFLITLDRVRLRWAALFALAWGVVIALVGFFTAGYNQQATIFEWPFLSGIAAVLLAAPLFQAARDEGARRFPVARIHHHVWTDATMGGVALLFTGLTFLITMLIGQLFKVIGIDIIWRLFTEEDWVRWVLAGAAFGGAVGLMRLKEKLLETVRKLAMVILVVLAPVLAVALWVFLLSLPVTGLSAFWNQDVPPTPLLLLGSFGAFALANIIIGDGEGDEQERSPILRASAQALVAVILPLAVLAAMSIGQRIGQYGWTPERLWGALAVGIALAYGVIGWWSLFKGRRAFATPLRPLQVKLALGVCGLALLLALPIVDFGRISASSQLARLESGKIKADEFDWAAMAFDFGPAGRKALDRIAEAGNAVMKPLAKKALTEKSRYALADVSADVAAQREIPGKVRLLSPDIKWTENLLGAVGDNWMCRQTGSQCAIARIDSERYLLVVQFKNGNTSTEIIEPNAVARVENLDSLSSKRDEKGRVASDSQPPKMDLATGKAEIRTVPRRQLFVDGQPVGEVFE